MDTLDCLEHFTGSRTAGGISQSRKPQRWHSTGNERLQAYRLRRAMSTSGQTPPLLLQVICSRRETGREARRKQEGIGRCDEGPCAGSEGTDGQIRTLKLGLTSCRWGKSQ